MSKFNETFDKSSMSGAEQLPKLILLVTVAMGMASLSQLKCCYGNRFLNINFNFTSYIQKFLTMIVTQTLL